MNREGAERLFFLFFGACVRVVRVCVLPGPWVWMFFWVGQPPSSVGLTYCM